MRDKHLESLWKAAVRIRLKAFSEIVEVDSFFPEGIADPSVAQERRNRRWFLGAELILFPALYRFLECLPPPDN